MTLIIKKILMVLFIFSFLIILSDGTNSKSSVELIETKIVARMLEKGRTFAHNLTKRFLVLIPAIFFKIGIAFTLLVLVTIVAINNGFIGFLLLVVGLSSALARFQERRNPSPASSPYIPSGISPYYRPVFVPQILDRSDRDTKQNAIDMPQQSQPFYQYYIKSNTDHYGQKLK